MRAKAILGAFLVAQCFGHAHADWPERRIEVVVPYAAGGGVDSFARPVVQKLSEQLGQPVMIANRTGAGGTVGVAFTAQAAKDGYTLLSGGVHQPMAEALYPNRGYQIDKDFAAIAITAVVPNVLVVNPDSGIGDVATLIARARANPGSFSYCSSGPGTSQHVIAESFLRETGLKMVAIHYRGTAPALNDLLAGQCQLMFDGMGTSAGHIESGKLKALAMTSARRSQLFPNIPTMAEAGGPTMDAGTWYAFWAPAGTPEPVVSRLRSEIKRAVASPEVSRLWTKLGAEVANIPDAEVNEFVRKETARWTQEVRQLGVKIN